MNLYAEQKHLKSGKKYTKTDLDKTIFRIYTFSRIITSLPGYEDKWPSKLDRSIF